VQLVCGQRAVCQRCGRWSVRSHQQQQHADSHVGFWHLQREVYCHVLVSSIHLTSKLNNALIDEMKLLYIGK
jgi:hypothetical protein